MRWTSRLTTPTGTGAGTDPLAAPATDGDEAGVPGIPSLRSRLSAISPSKSPRPPVPSAIAAATGPPAERKPVVRTRRVMLSPTEIAALGEYRMMTPEELATAPEWQEMPPEMAKRLVSPSDRLRYEQALK